MVETYPGGQLTSRTCINTYDAANRLTKESITTGAVLVTTDYSPVWFADEELLHLFEKLASYTSLEDPLPQVTHIAILINQLLITLLELVGAKSIVTDGTLSSIGRIVKQFLLELSRDAEMSSKPWTLESMAEGMRDEWKGV